LYFSLLFTAIWGIPEAPAETLALQDGPEEDPVVQIANITSAPGIVLVPVDMLNFTENVNAITFRINTDANLVAFIDLVNINPGFQGQWSYNQNDSMLLISWFDIGSGYMPDGHVFDLKFHYYGGFNADLSFADGNEVTYGLNPVPDIIYVDGSVNQEPPYGELGMDTIQAYQGSSVIMPVTISGSGYDSVTSLSIRIGYDTTGLSYDYFAGMALQGASVTDSSGTILIEWSDPGNPHNFNSPDTLLFLHFTFLGDGNTSVNYLSGSQVFNNNIPVPTVFTGGLVIALYILDLETEPDNAGQTNGSGYYLPGEEVMVSCTPNEGYAFENWTRNGTIISNELSFVYAMPSHNDTLVANFSLINYNVTLLVFPDGAGSTTGGGTYNLGDTVIVTAIPNPGYSFQFWTLDGNIVSFDTAYEFIMPARDLTFTATFSLIDYIIEVVPNDSAFGTVTGGGGYYYGDSVSLIATPEPGYLFIVWTENGNPVSYDSIYEFVVVSDRTLTGNFQANTDCPEPIALSVDEIGENTATLHWLPSGDEEEWDALWGISGFDTVSQGELISGLIENQTILEDLDQGTVYDFYVRSICLESVTSSWAGPQSFTTLFTGLPKAGSGDAFVIYPNPAASAIKIKYPDKTSRPGILKIYNTLGVVVFHKEKDINTDRSIQLPGLSPGIYTVRLFLEDHVYSKQLFIR